MLDTLADVYDEPNSLIRHERERGLHPLPPRATERSIAGRLLIHGHARVAHHFPDQSDFDLEYERVGPETATKTIRRSEAGKGWKPRKVSPDLVAHRRGDPQGNHLVIELKRRGRVRHRITPDGPATEDFVKVHSMTQCLEAHQEHPAPTPGVPSYELGVCMEVDTHGADLWWITRLRDHVCPPNCTDVGSGQTPPWHRERWEHGGVRPACPLPH